MACIRRRGVAALLTTALCAAAGLVAGAAPASADDSTYCPESGSTRLLTANDGAYKVWVYNDYNGWTHICFATFGRYFAGDLVVRSGLSGSPVPTVTPVLDPSCPRLFELQDPAHFLLQAWWNLNSSPYTICLGAEETAIRVTVATPTATVNPGVQLWLDPQAESQVTRLYCDNVASDHCDSYDYYYNSVRVL